MEEKKPHQNTDDAKPSKIDIECNISMKYAVIEKIEMIVNGASGDILDWEDYAQKFANLQEQWYNIDHIPLKFYIPLRNKMQRLEDMFDKVRFKYDTHYRKWKKRHITKRNQIIKNIKDAINQSELAIASIYVDYYYSNWLRSVKLPHHDEYLLNRELKSLMDSFSKREKENIIELEKSKKRVKDLLDAFLKDVSKYIEDDNYIEGHHAIQQWLRNHRWFFCIHRGYLVEHVKTINQMLDKFYSDRANYFEKRNEAQSEIIQQKRDIVDKMKRLLEQDIDKQTYEKFVDLDKAFNEVEKIYGKHSLPILDEYREIKKKVAKYLQEEHKKNEEAKRTIQRRQQKLRILKSKKHQLEASLSVLIENKTRIRTPKGSHPILDSLDQEIVKQKENIKNIEIEINNYKHNK